MCVLMDNLDGSNETFVRQATEQPWDAGRVSVTDFVTISQTCTVGLHREYEEGADKSRSPKAGPGDGAPAWRRRG